MALTAFQRSICRLLADSRIASGESYLAGGVALNDATAAARISRDIDLFHDTDTAVEASWSTDRALLERAGFTVTVLRERRAFVEAEIARDADRVRMEWVRDSAFRFFPLITHPDFGLTLHPVDLATNKVLALVGRVEVRDWIDVMASDRAIQPLGYLAWAACGKDPGFSPRMILDEAARTARYSAAEVAALQFDGPPPDATALARAWHRILGTGREVLDLLPPGEAGTCVLTTAGGLCRADATTLADLLASGGVRFHRGRIRGALPQVSSTS